MRIKSLASPIALIFLAAMSIVLVRTCWISDDAMITFRTVLNFIHGHGPVFNLGERVQAYTHPLWFLLLCLGTWITSSIYYFTFVFSMLISVVTMALLFIWMDSRQNKHWFVIACMILSKAFIDFSTSGLENPLFHLMILGGLIAGWQFLETKKPFRIQVSLLILFSIYLCRPDLLLLVFPFLLFLLSNVDSTTSKIRCVLISILPSVLWTLFSLFYYGFPFPNTAYAKLGMTVSHIDLIHHGIIYMSDSLLRDPITLIMIGLGVFTSLRHPKGEMKSLGIGIVLYLMYIVWIGGDFMSGRFLTAPFVVSAFVLATASFSDKKQRVLLVVFCILGIRASHSTVLSGRGYTDAHIIPPNGIVDERAYWFQKNGWFTHENFLFDQPPWNVENKRTWRICGNLGQTGLGMGPGTHLVDLCGLSDPLLARLPSYNFDGNWRIGHFYRQVPTDYEKAILMDDPSVLSDIQVMEYWKTLRIITHDDLFSSKRLGTILKMNLGLAMKPNAQAYATERIPSARVPISQLQKMNEQMIFYNSLEVDLGKPTAIHTLSFVFSDPLDRCTIRYEQGGQFVTLKEEMVRPSELNEVKIKLLVATPATQRIRIEPMLTLEKPVSRSSIGNFRINTL